MIEKIVNLSKTLLTIGAMACMISGCTSREKALGTLPSDISFSDSTVVSMAQNTSGAEKRKFADFNGDGLEDMGEVNDTVIFGQDYRMDVFPGIINDDNYLTFGSETFELKLPLKKKFSSSAVKIDSGDVNGDGWSDIIFTSFIDKIGDDEYLAEVALNDKEGSLKYVSTSVKDISDFSDNYKLNEAVNLAIALTYLAQSNYAMYGVYSSESISDYLMLDWADSNNDGKDDLYVFWKGKKSHLLVTVFPVESVDDNSIYFGKPSSTKVDRFMHYREMSRLDTEDYNGDGTADLCIYFPSASGKKLTLSVALGSNDDGNISFQPQTDVIVTDADMKFWTTLEKYDSFDGNKDGKADVAHMGIIDGEKVISYNFSK